MSADTAKAEVFWIAFQALSKRERQTFLSRLVGKKPLREEIMDLALIEERRREPTVPLEDYIAKRGRR